MMVREQPLSGTVFSLALSWLEPTDVARCSRVCRRWQHEIDEQVWKQAASNAEGMVLVEAIQAVKPAKLSYRSIARGLGQTGRPPTPTIPPVRFPKPKLQAQDLFLVATLKTSQASKSKTVGAWCGDWGEWAANAGEASCINLHGPPGLDIKGSEVERFDCGVLWDPMGTGASWSVLHESEATMRLYRCDTGQSLCIMSEQMVDPIAKGPFQAYFKSRGIQPEANNSAGSVARNLAYHRQYNYAEMNLLVGLEPVLPLVGSSEEPGWLKEARAGGGEALDGVDWRSPSLYIPSEFQFEYCVARVAVELSVSVGERMNRANRNFESVDDMLLYFDGLNWQ
jgi:hypothetical protein